MQNYRQFFDLSGRTAVVLGAASGIDQASAHAMGAGCARRVRGPRCRRRTGHGRADMAASAA
ncbi:MAG TPA: hypothetical protein VN280_08500 [Variovorax sp.]|nr:hypothetical protein [Variovorax sp.]